MHRQPRYPSKPLTLSRNLLGIGFCLCICTVTQAGGYSNALDAQSLNTIVQYPNATGIACGKQPGQRPATLNIRGADMATLWRSAYHMIFPDVSLADNGKLGRAAMVPHKGPRWGISINSRTAMISVQSKW